MCCSGLYDGLESVILQVWIPTLAYKQIMERLFLLLTFWSLSSLNPHLLQSCWAEPPRTTDCTAHLWVMNACICCCVNMKQGIHEKSMQAGLVFPLGENSDGVGVGCCSDVALSQSLWAVKGGWGHTRLRLILLCEPVSQKLSHSAAASFHLSFFFLHIIWVSLFKAPISSVSSSPPPALHTAWRAVSLCAIWNHSPWWLACIGPVSILWPLLKTHLTAEHSHWADESRDRGREVKGRDRWSCFEKRENSFSFHFIYLRLTLVTSILYVFHSEKPTLMQSFGNCKWMWETLRHSRVELKQLVDGQKNENSF